MASATLPCLMNLTCMNASGGGGYRGWNGGSSSGGWRRDPLEHRGDAPASVVAGLSGFSDQPADELVEGLGLARPMVEPSAAADQGTADDGTRPEDACGPPIADGEPVHGGAATAVLPWWSTGLWPSAVSVEFVVDEIGPAPTNPSSAAAGSAAYRAAVT
jgi:hypothetical protein